VVESEVVSVDLSDLLWSLSGPPGRHPLMGYADDAIIVTAVLRGITRRLILAVDEKST
jgi:hypothetical protein